jgi:hypothetical protein
MDETSVNVVIQPRRLPRFPDPATEQKIACNSCAATDGIIGNLGIGSPTGKLGRILTTDTEFAEAAD